MANNGCSKCNGGAKRTIPQRVRTPKISTSTKRPKR